MNGKPEEAPLSPEGPLEPRDSDLTVELDFEGEEEALDLQALADAVAEATPERPEPLDPLVEPDVSGRIIEELERTLEEATRRIKDLESREQDHLDKHQRLLADFANYRNRTQREIQMGVDLAEKKLLLELLPVHDSLERCLTANYSSVEDFREGVALIHKQCLDSLRRVGVELVSLQTGDPFDANHAEALTTITDPALADGAIAAIYERGFRLRELLLRPARVVVNHVEHEAPQAPAPLGDGDPIQ